MLFLIRQYGSIAHKSQKGQVLLTAILVMVVALTIGLSVVTRSIIQVKTSKDAAESQKAFSAAEAGIEQALKNGTSITNQQFGNSAVINSVSVSAPQSAKVLLNNATPLAQDDGADVWLSTYPTYANPWSGRARLYWGTTTGCSEAAIEAVLIAKNSSATYGYTMTKYAYDPCSTRASSNNFSQPAANSSGTVNGQVLNFSFPIDVTNGVMLRIIPLYTGTIVGVVGYANSSETTLSAFPSQGISITSVGTSGSTQREISYFQGYSTLPSELFYGLFSP